MAPVLDDCSYQEHELSNESGNESGSDSDAGGSSASGSRSSSPGSAKNQAHRSRQGSNRSGSRSPSPANSQASGSSQSEAGSHRSRKDSASSGKASQRSGSGSPADGRSPNDNAKSPYRSPSPGDEKSGSGSPTKGSDGGRSRSESPADEKSNVSDRSRSQSPEVNDTRKSRSRSIESNASRQNSASRSVSGDSDDESNHSKERSESPEEKNEREDNHERSESPVKGVGNKSDSGSEESTSKKNSKNLKDSPNDKIGNVCPKKIKSPQDEDGSASPQTAAKSRSGSPASDSGSDGGPKDSARKRKRVVLSDDSGSDVEKKKVFNEDEKEDGDESEKDLVIDAEALFGDASDISSDEEGKKKKKAPKPKDTDDHPQGDESEAESEKAKSGEEDHEMEVDEKDEEDKENIPEEPPPETRIDVQIPKITTDLGKDIHFVKLPNFLSVETRPFDPSTYEDEIDEEETLDEEGRARLKLKVENTIRWREVTKQNGEFEKQSNARFVKWSDGSMSLHLGSEIFDVYKQPLQGDHNHLFIRQGTGLQGQAVFRTKLTFRPHSTESFTHRKMTMSLADRSQKTAGIKILSLVGKDPEAHRGELIKKEEERLKASVRRESRQRRIREKGVNRGLSAGYLEPDRYGDMDSDDEGISISAIKKQHKNKMTNPRDDRSHIYSSDEDGSDIETRRARRLDKAKALKDSDSEGSGGGGDDGDAGKSGERSSSGED